MSVARGRNIGVGGMKKGSVKSKSTLRNKDEVSIGGHRSEVGGVRSPKKMRWNSTKQMSAEKAQADDDGDISQTELDQMSESPSKL